VGEVQIEAAYGQDPASGAWLCPLRLRWGLSPRQEMSPELEDRLCYTATRAGSFEAAAELAAKWDSPVDGATIHRHVQQVGGRAERLQEARVARALDHRTRPEVVAEAARHLGGRVFSLLIELDGWMVRERAAQWGLKPPEIKAERVLWHEMKSAAIFRLEDRVVKDGGRRLLVEKFTVAWRGGVEEFGRRLQAEALRRGLCQARRVYVVADGAVWIWNLVADRLSGSVELVDFYHASQHVWAVAHALYGEEPQAAAWAVPLLHQLKHGEAGRLVGELGRALGELSQDSAARAVVEGERAYFERHLGRLDYAGAAQAGCPLGSGAVESLCGQLQDRFKRTGQFWSWPGETQLLALELARRNLDWDQLWSTTW